MKNKLLIMIIFVALVLNINANKKSSIQDIDIIDVRLNRGSDTINTVSLQLWNLLDDTVSINSNFFIDEYYKPCHILIYRCEYSCEKDSIICDWGYFFDPVKPKFLNFGQERLINIPPRENISLEISLYSPYFDDCEVYFDVRFLCVYNGISKFVSKTTNKIHFKRVKSKIEIYQKEQNQREKDKN